MFQPVAHKAGTVAPADSGTAVPADFDTAAAHDSDIAARSVPGSGTAAAEIVGA